MAEIKQFPVKQDGLKTAEGFADADLFNEMVEELMLEYRIKYPQHSEEQIRDLAEARVAQEIHIPG